MKAINSNKHPSEPQYCGATAFFDILNRIDLTALKNAITGPGRRGPKLKEPDALIRLYLWYRRCPALATGDPPTVASLRRELEDSKSQLASLCRFDEDKELPDRKTFSNHIRRINEHPDLVRDALATIDKLVAYTPLGKPSSPAKKAKKGADQRNEREPKNRNRENVDGRKRRRQEAVGDEEFKPVVEDEASAQNFMLPAIHGDRPHCHICPRKEAEGWSCVKDHEHGVVVEMSLEPGQSRQWKCRCCESKLSVTAGTRLHGTNFSCRDILRTLHYMVHFRYGISAQDVAGLLNKDGRNASEGAVRMLMHRLRECMREETPEHFKGETEIDEMLLRLNDGRQVSIISAYNRPTGRVRFQIIERKGKTKPKANKREMLKFIRETTAPGSIILTDGDAAIPKLAAINRKHGSVNHKRFQFLKYSDLGSALDKPIEVTVNRAEGIHGFMRRTLRIRNGITRHYLERYLAEAMWRINHLHNKVESKAYDSEERRNLSLMRDVLAGAAGRKVTLQDLRGEPQRKHDTNFKRTRTAPVPVPSDETPIQRTLPPPAPMVSGTSQPESGQIKTKLNQPHPARAPRPGRASHTKPVQRHLPPPAPMVSGTSQPESGQIKTKPNQPRPARAPRPGRASHTKPVQRRLPSREEDAVGSKPAQSHPLEESEQVLAA